MRGQKSEYIFDCFEQTCLLCSNAVAVIDQSTGQETTYSELLDKVTYFSEILQVILDPNASDSYQGVPLVSILTSRSLATIVSIFGLFHCGAAFNLIDGSIFEKNSIDVNEKLHVFTHPSCQILIVDEGNLAQLKQLKFAVPLPPMIMIDSVGNILDVSQIKKRHDPVVPVRASAETALAYLHYTSGCLGKPRGVLVTHRGLSNVLIEFNRIFKLCEDDRVLFHTNLSFESALIEIFLPLVSGASVVIASSKVRKNLDRLMETFESLNITFIQGVVSLFDRLTAQGWKGKGNLTIIIDNEVINPSFIEVINNCSRVYNVYSCTETTLWSAFYLLPKGMNHETILQNFGNSNGVIPIGRPISNVKFHLLNENLQEVLPGESGELYISGYGMSLGYLQNKLQTALKFIPNPVTMEAGNLGPIGQIPVAQRCFKTGDILRQLPDGNYLFERRLDDVAKFQGFKFELKEVRLYLESFPKIAQAVAVVIDDSLVALIKLKPNSTIDVKENLAMELKEHLRPLLPHYMIPREFVVMESIPTLPNGRVDRQLLLLPPKNSIRRTWSTGSEIGICQNDGHNGSVEEEILHQDSSSFKYFSDSILACFCCPSSHSPAQVVTSEQI